VTNAVFGLPQEVADYFYNNTFDQKFKELSKILNFPCMIFCNDVQKAIDEGIEKLDTLYQNTIFFDMLNHSEQFTNAVLWDDENEVDLTKFDKLCSQLNNLLEYLNEIENYNEN